jgi:hypothetical protein
MAVLLAGLAGTALSAGLGAAESKSASEDFALARRRGQKSIDQFQRPLDAQHYAQMEQFLRQAMGAQTGGYDNALANLSLVGRGARRDAIGRGRQDLASGLQGLSSSGLGSSTLQQNYRSGAASQLSRDLSGIDEQLAGLRSNLLVGKGQAQGQGYASLADLFGQRQRRDAELEGLRYGLFTGSAPQTQGVDMSGIANFASLFANKGAGNMGGGNFFGGAATAQGGAAGQRLLNRYPPQ